MHNDSVDFVVKSIQKTPLVNLNGLIYQEYQDFFDDVWLEKLKIDLEKLKLTTLEKQEKLEKSFRRRVDYSETISKELNIFFKNKKITTCLEEIFGIKLTPDTSDIWIDYPGYYLTPHLDDTRIKLAIQIYIGDQQQPGTSLYSSSKISSKVHEIVYKRNKGYALLNNDKSWHAVQPEIVDGQRRSVYIRYK
jgi:hypothetical protein